MMDKAHSCCLDMRPERIVSQARIARWGMDTHDCIELDVCIPVVEALLYH